jgi:hypothetical protein
VDPDIIIGPVGPVGPVAPVGPVEPCGPVGPPLAYAAVTNVVVVVMTDAVVAVPLITFCANELVVGVPSGKNPKTIIVS